MQHNSSGHSSGLQPASTGQLHGTGLASPGGAVPLHLRSNNAGGTRPSGSGVVRSLLPSPLLSTQQQRPGSARQRPQPRPSARNPLLRPSSASWRQHSGSSNSSSGASTASPQALRAEPSSPSAHAAPPASVPHVATHRQQDAPPPSMLLPPLHFPQSQLHRQQQMQHQQRQPQHISPGPSSPSVSPPTLQLPPHVQQPQPSSSLHAPLLRPISARAGNGAAARASVPPQSPRPVSAAKRIRGPPDLLPAMSSTAHPTHLFSQQQQQQQQQRQTLSSLQAATLAVQQAQAHTAQLHSPPAQAAPLSTRIGALSVPPPSLPAAHGAHTQGSHAHSRPQHTVPVSRHPYFQSLQHRYTEHSVQASSQAPSGHQQHAGQRQQHSASSGSSGSRSSSSRQRAARAAPQGGLLQVDEELGMGSSEDEQIREQVLQSLPSAAATAGGASPPAQERQQQQQQQPQQWLQPEPPQLQLPRSTQGRQTQQQQQQQQQRRWQGAASNGAVPRFAVGLEGLLEEPTPTSSTQQPQPIGHVRTPASCPSHAPFTPAPALSTHSPGQQQQEGPRQQAAAQQLEQQQQEQGELQERLQRANAHLLSSTPAPRALGHAVLHPPPPSNNTFPLTPPLPPASWQLPGVHCGGGTGGSSSSSSSSSSHSQQHVQNGCAAAAPPSQHPLRVSPWQLECSSSGDSQASSGYGEASQPLQPHPWHPLRHALLHTSDGRDPHPRPQQGGSGAQQQQQQQQQQWGGAGQCGAEWVSGGVAVCEEEEEDEEERGSCFESGPFGPPTSNLPSHPSSPPEPSPLEPLTAMHRDAGTHEPRTQHQVHELPDVDAVLQRALARRAAYASSSPHAALQPAALAAAGTGTHSDQASPHAHDAAPCLHNRGSSSSSSSGSDGGGQVLRSARPRRSLEQLQSQIETELVALGRMQDRPQHTPAGLSLLDVFAGDGTTVQPGEATGFASPRADGTHRLSDELSGGSESGLYFAQGGQAGSEEGDFQWRFSSDGEGGEGFPPYHVDQQQQQQQQQQRAHSHGLSQLQLTRESEAGRERMRRRSPLAQMSDVARYRRLFQQAAGCADGQQQQGQQGYQHRGSEGWHEQGAQDSARGGGATAADGGIHGLTPLSSSRASAHHGVHGPSFPALGRVGYGALNHVYHTSLASLALHPHSHATPPTQLQQHGSAPRERTRAHPAHQGAAHAPPPHTRLAGSRDCAFGDWEGAGSEHGSGGGCEGEAVWRVRHGRVSSCAGGSQSSSRSRASTYMRPGAYAAASEDGSRSSSSGSGSSSGGGGFSSSSSRYAGSESEGDAGSERARLIRGSGHSGSSGSTHHSRAAPSAARPADADLAAAGAEISAATHAATAAAAANARRNRHHARSHAHHRGGDHAQHAARALSARLAAAAGGHSSAAAGLGWGPASAGGGAQHHTRPLLDVDQLESGLGSIRAGLAGLAGLNTG